MATTKKAKPTTKKAVKKATEVDALFAVAAALSRIGDVLEVLAQRYIVEDPPVEPEQREPTTEVTSAVEGLAKDLPDRDETGSREDSEP